MPGPFERDTHCTFADRWKIKAGQVEDVQLKSLYVFCSMTRQQLVFNFFTFYPQYFNNHLSTL